MVREFIAWQGHQVCVSELGRGRPLFLVPGIGCSADMWEPFIHYFPNRHIVSFDAPGAGRSSVPLYPVSVPALAALAAAVLDSRRVDCTDVLGFSYGGAIAQQLAYDYPERVSRLVLAATNCGLGSYWSSPGALAVMPTPLRFYGSYGYAMQLLGSYGWSSWSFLPHIRHETLVVCGDDDPLVPLVNARMLADRIPRATLEVVERAGHLVLWDEPERVAPQIGQFVGWG